MRDVKNIELKNVKISLAGISDDGVTMDGLRMKFTPLHEDKIHFTSEGDIVRVFPNDLSINLDVLNLSKIYGLLIETVSSYLHNIRSEVLQRDLVQEVYSTIDENYKIRVRVSKMFFREEEKGRYKVSFAFISKETNEEEINISFSKRDVQLILSIIRHIASSYEKDYGTFVVGEYINTETGSIQKTDNIKIAKIQNSIIIGDTWLHGQEISNLQFTVNELINRLHVEKNLQSLRSQYRQIKLYEEDSVLFLELNKLNSLHESDSDTTIKIPLTQNFLAIFYLYVNMDILSKIPEEDFIDSDVEVFGKKDIFPGEKIKYHLTMKESILSIAIRDRNKTDDKKMLLLGQSKSDQFQATGEDGEELDNFIVRYEDGEKKYVDLLQNFKIDLRDQWKKLVRALSMGYTQEYLSERDRNLTKFFVINQDSSGRFKYQFIISSDAGNKAPAVLIIEKFKLKNGEEEFIGKYRQPLFRRYVYQLLSMILTTAKDMDYVRFADEMKSGDLMKYSYKSMGRVQAVKKSKLVEYGIEKRLDGSVHFGTLNEEKTQSALTKMDRILLTATSEFKLLNGYWLPIVSEKVTIGQDGYLKDMYSELNLEEGYGVDWATVLYFGSKI